MNAGEMSTAGFCLVGVLHLPPLPGASNYEGRSVSDIAAAAAADAIVLERAGFTHVMVQDASDNPQPTRAAVPTIAALSVVGAAVTGAISIPVGVIVGHNDGPAAVAIAHAIGARFVRVKVLTGVSAGPTGLIQGCAVEVAAMKRLLGSDVEVWADAHEATSVSLAGSRAWAAAEAVNFGGADAIVVTEDSGVTDALASIALLRDTLPVGIRLIVGGRATVASMPQLIEGSNGVIVGSALKDSHGSSARIAPHVAADFASAIPPEISE